jgi:hypothetical protein
VRQLEQQLVEEANKGKALRDQLEKMETKLANTEKYGEQFSGQLHKVPCKQQEKASNELQVQIVKIHFLTLRMKVLMD